MGELAYIGVARVQSRTYCSGSVHAVCKVSRPVFSFGVDLWRQVSDLFCRIQTRGTKNFLVVIFVFSPLRGGFWSESVACSIRALQFLESFFQACWTLELSVKVIECALEFSILSEVKIINVNSLVQSQAVSTEQYTCKLSSQMHDGYLKHLMQDVTTMGKCSSVRKILRKIVKKKLCKV